MMLRISPHMMKMLEKQLPSLQPGEIRRIEGLGNMHASLAGTFLGGGYLREFTVKVLEQHYDIYAKSHA